MKLTIDRSRWLRGGKDGNGVPSFSTLRSLKGHMCCLGFYGAELGCPLDGTDPEEELDEDTGLPYAGWPRWLVREEPAQDGPVKTYLTDDCCELINVNDLETISDESREARIAALFAKHGVDVVFIDKANGRVGP